MKLSSTYRYTILCEDKLSQCYIRRFLLAQGISRRKIFPSALPAAGCGEQYVREQFPRYLQALRSKNFNATVLVIAIDADKKTCSEREAQLQAACSACAVAPWSKNDKLLLFIPKRAIETWIKHFAGETVDEEHDYAHFLNGHESDCYQAADKMARDFSLPSFSSSLISLQDAYDKYASIAACQACVM